MFDFLISDVLTLSLRVQIQKIIDEVGNYNDRWEGAVNKQCLSTQQQQKMGPQSLADERRFQTVAILQQDRSMDAHDAFCNAHGLGRALKEQTEPLFVLRSKDQAASVSPVEQTEKNVAMSAQVSAAAWAVLLVSVLFWL